MTVTYDPFHPAYFDLGDLREELTRVYDLCHGCRMCFKLCPAFPSLFEMIDEHDDQDAARLTPDQQDRVVDECFNCKICYVICPYTPGQHEWAIDFPRLMLRAEQARKKSERTPLGESITNQVLGRTDLVGKVNTTFAPLVNHVMAEPGSLARRVLEKTVGIASERLLPPFTRQRFSTWFAKRAAPITDRPSRGEVALFATCLLEYQQPEIGHDLVKVCERNDISCTLPEGQVCCGAPWLHQGDVERFVAQGERNVEILAKAVREGRDIVVPQPTCSYVLKYDYVDYLGGPEAALVAEHTYDISEYLMSVHKAQGTELDTEFGGTVPDAVTYHAPCHLRAQNMGYKSRDLLKLTGTSVTVVAECSGIDGTWGYRAENYEMARGVARKMAKAIDAADNDVIAGDCTLANGGIRQEVGKQPLHPIQLVARAYGIPEEPG